MSRWVTPLLAAGATAAVIAAVAFTVAAVRSPEAWCHLEGGAWVGTGDGEGVCIQLTADDALTILREAWEQR